jgi:riboflavin synthase
MFTGLVEGQGTLQTIQTLPAGLRLSIAPQPQCFSVADIQIGDSVSISGCCLTVVAVNDDSLDFEAGEETLSKTSLGSLQVGDCVNLERSLSVGGRLGGHFVQGHVDGVAHVSKIEQTDEWIDMWYRASPELLRLMVPKGSVAVDGISLTVVHLEPDQFSVALIPHTLQVTTLGSRSVGDPVNIENDVLGKYVDQLLQHRLPNASS